ncbi:MAG: hypothetical protein ACTSYJ_05395 [Candidatus Thorarchaeota archaeon]
MKKEKDSTDMAEDLVDAIDNDADQEDVDDGLTKRERAIEVSRTAEREKKAQKLKKQLRKRSLGMLNFRWPMYLLVIGGGIAIITNFLQVMIRNPIVPTEVGFHNFIEAFSKTGGAIYLFPIVAGVIMIILGYFAYTTPRYAWVSLIPAIMLGMAGATVYFLITFAVDNQPHLTGEIYASIIPLVMFLAAGLNLVAIAVKETE